MSSTRRDCLLVAGGLTVGLLVKPVMKSVKKLLISSTKQKNVAVILSGCGVYDGSEISESVSCLVHLSACEHVKVTIFAPDMLQHHLVNHTDGKASDTKRNVLTESARIARGKIHPLNSLNPDLFDAIVVPGGVAFVYLYTFTRDLNILSMNINK